MTTTKTRMEDSRSEQSPPPFRPDPEIMGNIEGNRRILEHDRRAARRFLEESESVQEQAADE